VVKSETVGKIILEAEVTRIDKQGIWLLIGEKESFLSFEDFPWFRNAPASAIHNVDLVNPRHLHWPDLDVDLAVESIEHPERFPFIAESHK
jgi:hypothetical protein